MKTQYFLMLSGSYRDQTKRLVCHLNPGMLSSFSLVTHPRANAINIASQVINNQSGISSGIESLFDLEAAYWCALNNALNKNTPSA